MMELWKNENAIAECKTRIKSSSAEEAANKTKYYTKRFRAEHLNIWILMQVFLRIGEEKNRKFGCPLLDEQIAGNDRRIILSIYYSLCNSFQIHTELKIRPPKNTATSRINMQIAFKRAQNKKDKEGRRCHRSVSQTLTRLSSVDTEHSNFSSDGASTSDEELECKLISCLNTYSLVCCGKSTTRSVVAPLQRPLFDSLNLIMDSTQKCRAFL